MCRAFQPARRAPQAPCAGSPLPKHISNHCGPHPTAATAAITSVPLARLVPRHRAPLDPPPDPQQPRQLAAATMSGVDDFYVRYYVGHKGKFGHEFLEFEFRPDGKVIAGGRRLWGV